jgi:hypothetical protein
MRITRPKDLMVLGTVDGAKPPRFKQNLVLSALITLAKDHSNVETSRLLIKAESSCESALHVDELPKSSGRACSVHFTGAPDMAPKLKSKTPFKVSKGWGHTG